MQGKIESDDSRNITLTSESLTLRYLQMDCGKARLELSFLLVLTDF